MGTVLSELERPRPQSGRSLHGLWVAVVVLLVAGPVSAVVVGRQPQSASLATITASAAAAEHAKRLTITSIATTHSSGGLESTIRTTMAFDAEQRVGRLTMAYEGLPIPEPDFEFVFSPDAMFLRVPDGPLRISLGRAWISAPVPPGTDAKKVAPGSAAGTRMLEDLAGGRGTVTEVGHETVDGVDTTHYRVTVDAEAMAARAQRNQAAAGFTPPEMNLPESKITTAPADVWIDDEGLPRRQVMRVTSTLGRSTATSMTDTRYDYEAPVSVSMPGPDEAHPVATIQDAFKLLFQSVGNPGGP